MEIEYLPVYVPTAEDRDNPTLFAQHVQVGCFWFAAPLTVQLHACVLSK